MADPRDPIRNVMSSGAISVDEKVTLRSVAGVLSELEIGVVVVADDAGAASVVSERDIVRALADGGEPDDIWAIDVSAPDIVIIDPEESILDAAERMTSENLRHLVVVEHGRVTGVVSARDILPLLASYTRSTL
jgi:predicted transcriptional regulator